MKKLNMLAAVGALTLTLGLTGCGSDSKSDTSSTSSQSQSQGQSDGGQTGAAGSSSAADTTATAQATPGGVSTCKLDRKGSQVDASVTSLTCEDATAIWNKFSGKDSDMANADVEYKGETFKCSSIAQGASVAAGCVAGAKVISITSA